MALPNEAHMSAQTHSGSRYIDFITAVQRLTSL